MDRILELEKRLENQEKRLEIIEKKLNISSNIKKEIKLETPKVLSEANNSHKNKTERVEHKKLDESQKPKFSFTQVLSFLGISGIIIGILSLFFYAISRNWISEMGQILIGILIGLVLYFFGILSYKKNKTSFEFLIGGALFVEFLSIGFGVLGYEVIHELFGLFLLVGFLVVSLFFSIKFNSKIIAYYSLVGGYLIPVITKLFFSSNIFIYFYLLLLGTAILIISSKYNWSDIRFVSFLIQSLYLVVFTFTLFDMYQYFIISLIFLTLNFLIFNISGIIFSIKNDEKLNSLDIILSNLNSFIYTLFLFILLNEQNFSTFASGLFLIPIAFLFLGEVIFIKKIISKENKNLKAIYFSFLSSGIIVLNLIVFMIFNNFGFEFLLIFFIIEWFLFSYISNTKQEKELNFYSVVSIIFLLLILIWYLFVLRFDSGLLHGTFYLIVLLSIPLLSYILNSKDIMPKVTGAVFLISNFLVIYSFSRYLAFFNLSEPLIQVILTVLWLIYTLTMLKLLYNNKPARVLLIILFVITLLKIIFIDLQYLRGVFKIIGFIIFGIILLIGGYFIKNEKN